MCGPYYTVVTDLYNDTGPWLYMYVNLRTCMWTSALSSLSGEYRYRKFMYYYYIYRSVTVVSVLSLASVSERSYHRKPNNSRVFSKEYNSFRLLRSSAIESCLFCVVVFVRFCFILDGFFFSVTQRPQKPYGLLGTWGWRWGGGGEWR